MEKTNLLHGVVSRLERLPEEQRAAAASVIQRELDRLRDGDRREAAGRAEPNERVRGTLRASEAQLRLIVRRMPAILWTIDTKMTFTSSMGAGLALLGPKPDEVVGMSLHDFLGPNDPDSPSIRAHLRALAGEAVSYKSEVAGHAFESAVEPLLNQGRIVGAIGVAVDTTERMQVEEARRCEPSDIAAWSLPQPSSCRPRMRRAGSRPTWRLGALHGFVLRTGGRPDAGDGPMAGERWRCLVRCDVRLCCCHGFGQDVPFGGYNRSRDQRLGPTMAPPNAREWGDGVVV